MQDVLLSTEADFLIDSLKPQKLETIGTKRWLEWHQRLQKLNQQALIEVATVKEEHIKETLVSFRKVPVLIHEAILINIWKHKVLPEILRLEINPDKTFVAYAVLFHEGTAVALLELCMFHENCVETLEDSAMDLLDYVSGTVSQLLVVDHREPEIGISGKEQLKRQQENLAFDIGIRSLSIIRYLAEYMESLPLGVSNQMYVAYDIPVLLIEVLMQKPWREDNKIYCAGRWMEKSDEALCQAEAQVWLALHQLLLNPACSTHYTITNSRRVQLMKLPPLMSPILLDQLSPLVDLKQWLCQIALTSTSEAKQNPVLLEPVLEIKQKILQQGEGKWKQIAKKQLPNIFIADQKDIMEVAAGLSEAYNTDLIEHFDVKTTRVCSQCGKDAIQRCSRCKKEWYCSRSCQVTHWPQHKEICNP